MEDVDEEDPFANFEDDDNQQANTGESTLQDLV